MDNQPIIIIKKKRAGGHGGHHGGAWKVAYADFVTAMMAFFMVMWLMGSDEETLKAVEGYFKTGMISKSGQNASGAFNGGDPKSMEGGAKGRFEEKELAQPHYSPPVYVEEYGILKDLSDAYDGSAFSQDVEGDWVKYTLTPRVKFEQGSSEIFLDRPNQKLVMKLIEIFKQHDGIIIVEGFPDQTQNWVLAHERALSVIRLLVNNEVSQRRLVPVSGAQVREDGDGLDDISLKDVGTVKFTLKRKRI